MALRELTISAVFDNWRMLHGRSAFVGKRRMCGGYSKLISPRNSGPTNGNTDGPSKSTMMILYPVTVYSTTAAKGSLRRYNWTSALRISRSPSMAVDLIDEFELRCFDPLGFAISLRLVTDSCEASSRLACARCCRSANARNGGHPAELHASCRRILYT
jgi:hypothetical protein